MHGIDLLSDIATALVAAALVALAARALRQPLILGYLLAGVAVGPALGLGLVRQREAIELISEIGLILLLFIVGLEMDLPKLRSVGRAVVATGLVQFLLCAALGVAAALALGFPLGGGRFDAAYVAVALSLSSTMIVVKLLYEKHELATFPGRVTLGVLVLQDVWAILALALQPTLGDPSAAALLVSLMKGAGLVLASLALSRYLLPRLFASVAKAPELLLLTALAWCFLVSGAAGSLGLSREMGALVAGVALSAFPYNLDVIAKVINVRDFFVPLFFVALGMQIQAPSLADLSLALALSTILIASRLLTVFPPLYLSGAGLRAALLPTINLAQMSEFSLVIAALGLSLGHVRGETVAVLTLAFALSSLVSTYAIAYNHELQGWLSRLLQRVGLRERAMTAAAEAGSAARSELVLLGFYQDASAIVHQLEIEAEGSDGRSLLPELLVIDFNPAVLEELRRRGIRGIYGDLASMDTLHHASLGEARLVACTLTDSILKGTTNARLLQQIRRLTPGALVAVASDTLTGALQLYEAGADFVYVPRLHSVHRMVEVLRAGIEEGLQLVREEELASLKGRREILA